MMDNRTLQLISARQGVNYSSGFAPIAKLRYCGRCGGTVLKGLDDEWCAGEATAEPVIVSETGEASALIEGRASYRLLGGTPTTLRLFYRNAAEIAHGHVAGWRVVVEHRCDRPIPREWVRSDENQS
jgi:hypothetical protein